jgi:hypothetical protein
VWRVRQARNPALGRRRVRTVLLDRRTRIRSGTASGARLARYQPPRAAGARFALLGRLRHLRSRSVMRVRIS